MYVGKNRTPKPLSAYLNTLCFYLLASDKEHLKTTRRNGPLLLSGSPLPEVMAMQEVHRENSISR